MKMLKVFLLLLLPVTALAQQETAEAAEANGKAVFEHYCTPCHGSGPGDDGATMLPGTYAIFVKYRGEQPPLLQDRKDINYEFVRNVVRGGLASMPPFRKTELTDEDIADIIAWFKAEPDN